MPTHFDFDDDELIRQIENCSFEAQIFNHEAHLRIAWIHITRHGVEQAVHNLCEQIHHYADSLGARDKFNMTLTIAAVRVVNHFMQKSSAKDFQSFITENPRLKNNFKELLKYHYATDIFSSAVAKGEYLEPELIPFD